MYKYPFCWYVKFVIDPERPTKKHTMIREDIINLGGNIQVSSNRKQYIIFQQTRSTFMENMQTLFKHDSIQHYRQLSHWIDIEDNTEYINNLISQLENLNVHIMSVQRNLNQTITLNFSETRNSIDKYHNIKKLMDHKNILDYGPIKFKDQPVML